MSWLQKLREGLKKTSSKIELALRSSKLDDEALENLEEASNATTESTEEDTLKVLESITEDSAKI